MKEVGQSAQMYLGSSFPTYRAIISTATPPATATDILNIAPAVGIACVITRASVSLTATAATNYDVFTFRRTTANTGGSPLTLTTASQAFASGTASIIQMDSADTASTSTVVAYAAAATAGTGTIVQADHSIAAAPSSSTTPAVPFLFDTTTRGAKPLVIRNGQSFSVGFNGQAVPAGTVAFVSVEWVEVPVAMLF